MRLSHQGFFSRFRWQHYRLFRARRARSSAKLSIASFQRKDQFVKRSLQAFFSIFVVVPLLLPTVVLSDGHSPTQSPLEPSSCDSDAPANCPISGEADESGSAPPGIGPTNSVGNPINLFNGNKQQRESDFSIPGSKLRFTRIYNSANTDHNLGLGQGWHHSYAVALFDTGDGSRDIVQSDGRRIHFTPDGQDVSGNPLLRSGGSNEGYLVQHEGNHLWHLPDGRQLRFRGSYLVEIDWPDQRRLALFYRQQRLASVTDETGLALQFHYTPGKKSLAGYETERFRAQPGLLESLTLPDGRSIAYDYDQNSNLTRVRYSDETSREYHYEDTTWRSHLTGLTDRTGVRFATWAYDTEGRAVLSEHADGVERVTLQYPDTATVESGAEVVTRITNSLGLESAYRWHRPSIDVSPQLLTSSGAGCTTCPATGVSYTYDESHRLVGARIVGEGNVTGTGETTYRYDSAGRLAEVRFVSETGTEEHIERRTYQGDNLRPERVYLPSVNPEGERVTEMLYTTGGLLISVTERGFAPHVALPGEQDGDRSGFIALERTTRYSYEARRLVAIDGPLENIDDVTHLIWNDAGRLIRIESPVGAALRLGTFDANGRASELRIGKRTPYQITYDTRGGIESITHAGGGIQFERDAEGRPIRVTDSDGHVMERAFDAAGRITRISDDFGQVSALVHDTESRETSRSVFGFDGSLVAVLERVFDATGVLEELGEKRIHNATGAMHTRRTRLEHDEHGMLSAMVDAASDQRVGIVVDPMARLMSIVTPGVGTTAFMFDAIGQRAGVIDALGNETRQLHDDFGQLVGIKNPDSGAERLERDAAGSVVRRVREDSGTTRYSRNAIGQLLERRATDGSVARFEYDPAHARLTMMRLGESIERFTYDDEAELISHVREIDGLRFQTRYSRDARGRTIRKQLPDGQVFIYRYHEFGPEAGTLQEIVRTQYLGLAEQSIVSSIDLEHRDGRGGWTAHNGYRSSLEFAPNGELSLLATPGLQESRNVYDTAGRIVERIDNDDRQVYQYDGVRLVSVNTPLDEIRFTYDAVGNRRSRTHLSIDGTEATDFYRYAVDERQAGGARTGNRLVSVRDSTSNSISRYSYDVGGSPLSDGKLSYTYDSERRLVQVSKDRQPVAAYTYNATGERVKKVVFSSDEPPKVTYYLFEDAHMVAEADESGKLTAQYVYLEDHRPVVKLEGEQLFAVHTDSLGTPTAMSDSHGVIVWQANIGAFGVADVVVEEKTLDIRLPGQYADAETGNYYNYFRDYDPDTGRYLTSDPIGLNGGFNAYAYVGAMPTMNIDPLGLEPTRSQAITLEQVGRIVRTYDPDDIWSMRYLDRSGTTATQVGPFGGSSGGRYVWTTRLGWIDLAHLFDVAANIDQRLTDPDGAFYESYFCARLPGARSVVESRLWQETERIEEEQSRTIGADGGTVWSYEDAPSNLAGLDYVLDYYDPDTPIEDTIMHFLNDAGAADPTTAPNWEHMQEIDDGTRHFEQNRSFDPVLNPIPVSPPDPD